MLHKIKRKLRKYLAPKSYNASAAEVYNFWLSVGLSPAQACGMVANAEAESSFDPKAIGDHGHAFGVHQLHRDRTAVIKKGCGIDITTLPPIPVQLKGIWWELQHSENHALVQLKKTILPYDAGAMVCKYYERPASIAQRAKRGNSAAAWFQTFNKK